jgi:predicted enzyme involved in methoxymalonyl-ACP biosynthesis
MSCRALGRGIEIILLKECIKASLNMDSKALYGIYMPTNKNLQVKDFYSKNGFEVISSNKDQTEFKWTQNNLHELEQNHILEKKK